MKITAEDFVRLANAAASTAQDSHPVPVARMARLEAFDGMLVIRATDMQYWLSLSALCEDDLPAVLVPAKKLAEVASGLKADTVDLTVDGDALHVKAGRSKRKLNAQSASTFPSLPAVEGDAVEVDAARLRECIDYCAPFTNPSDQPRPYCQGVFMGGNVLRGTEGNIVAQIDFAQEASSTPLPTAILTAAFAKAFRDIVPDGIVNLVSDEKRIAVTWGSGSIEGPLIEAQYPAIERVIPESTTTQIAVNAADMLGALAGAKAFANAHGGIGLYLSPEKVELRAVNQAGEAIDELPAVCSGDVESVGLKADYLARALRGFGKDTVVIGMNSATEPVKFTSGEATDRLAIVMPMRL